MNKLLYKKKVQCRHYYLSILTQEQDIIRENGDYPFQSNSITFLNDGNIDSAVNGILIPAGVSHTFHGSYDITNLKGEIIVTSTIFGQPFKVEFNHQQAKKLGAEAVQRLQVVETTVGSLYKEV